MNKQQLLTQAKRIVDERRFAAEEKAQATLDALRSDPKWRETEKQLRAAQVDLAMGVGDENKLKKTIADAEKRQRVLLKEAGVDGKSLVPQYSCKLCNDTGYVNGKTCRCLEKELRKLLVSYGNVPNTAFTFENNAETDSHNLAVAKKLKQICRDGNKNVLLLGKVGTGKTYWLTACANLAAQTDKDVLFVTAYSLNARFLEAYLDSAEAVRSLLESLTDVDLLLIDDLGTEKLFNNVTVNYLFAILNERSVNKKQTFFTSNLTLNEISERYDERIVSRLVDQNSTFVAQLVGADKRISRP